jgi:hypothetical protein
LWGPEGFFIVLSFGLYLEEVLMGKRHIAEYVFPEHFGGRVKPESGQLTDSIMAMLRKINGKPDPIAYLRVIKTEVDMLYRFNGGIE